MNLSNLYLFRLFDKSAELEFFKTKNLISFEKFKNFWDQFYVLVTVKEINN